MARLGLMLTAIKLTKDEEDYIYNDSGHFSPRSER